MSNAPTITLTCDKCTRPVDVPLPGHFDRAARADIANAAKLRVFRCPECCGEDAIHCEGDAARTPVRRRARWRLEDPQPGRLASARIRPLFTVRSHRSRKASQHSAILTSNQRARFTMKRCRGSSDALTHTAQVMH